MASAHQDLAENANRFKWSISIPAVIAAVVVLVLIVAVALMPIDEQIQTIFLSVLTSALGAIVILIAFDVPSYRRQLIEISNKKVMFEQSGILAASRPVLEKYDNDELDDLIRTALAVRSGLSVDYAAETDAFLDACLRESLAKANGIYSTDVVITRKISPYKNEDGATTAWIVNEVTETYFRNGSTKTLPFTFGGTYESRALEDSMAASVHYQLIYYKVRFGESLVYSCKSFPSVPCSINPETGKREWDPRYPTDDRIPTELRPGESLNIELAEEFLIPVGEDARIRWTNPRKSLDYTVECIDIDMMPELSLTGCSLCRNGLRNHGCTSCVQNGPGIIIESKRRIAIPNMWAGTDLGVNIKWV